ncbi:hypothetical protein BVC71_01650 [Marivivens niveibacter]|uniref:Uncharacterized protein n=1 Tax=Marivivens niveibacter TaxID=1930667 RepID=A0A251X1P8_9RHOB|nr:DUF6732 family protein [Marivivens niveibacter]OUD10244.1 hypothetical protein BVC71_01650 [Marivivens niveibacter]
MKKIATSILMLSATSAAAHSGHDAALSGVAHWTLSPLHGLGVIALAAVLFGIRTFFQKE